MPVMEQAVVLVDSSLANDLQCQKAAKCAAALAAKALVDKKDAVVYVWDSNAAASAALAFAEDKWCQEDAAQQCRAEADCVMVPVEPPDHSDMEIWHIRAECTLRAAPLNTILAEIACNNITHNALATLLTTSPPPMAMLSTSPCPMQ